MKTLCMVPCGNRKIWDKNPKAGSTKAEYVYIGPFAKKCREYAMRFYPSSWCILSAKYGFLFPDELVTGPYNVSFNDPKTNPITTKELFAQVKEKGLDNYDRIVILGGKNYVEMANEVFSSKEILSPLSDCKGIGYMMGKLNDSIKRGVPL
ncbi:MAG: hypothetical protein BWX89_01764 [candidate division TA06 bacterium ADurb.Bin131]|uniref:DUF6884 domain-containing protein n=1 Tax=candidate division TA06 bacterium ADurb.Bin131 TaxID=1852827 RepID=A0A1V6C402_UNCT6|nr:MAG: hypothetical protein BWX89_01764 [candidate division TA06 bacterium ADurb.Bin131]